MEPKSTRLSNHSIGVLAVLGSVVFFVTMNVLARSLKGIPPAEKVMYRMVVGVIAVLFMVRFSGVRWRFGHWPLLMLRGVLGGGTTILYFYALDNIPLARASFLLFTYPAWGAVFSWLFLKEPLGWKRVPAILVIYTGALLLLISNPASTGESTRAGDIAGLISGLAAGAATTNIRALHRHDSTWMIFFAFVFVSSALGAALTFGGGAYVQPSSEQWLVLLGIGLSSTGAHLLFTAGFRYLDVAATGSLAMFQAPLSAIAAYFLLGEDCTVWIVVGGLLVLSGGLWLAMTSKARAMVRVSDKAQDAAAP